MSYILEALKKSEQERERERGALPDIKSIHSPSTSSQKEGRNWWPIILFAVIVVAVAFFLVPNALFVGSFCFFFLLFLTF